MNINWDNIRYLFQIPLDWFRSISNKVFKAYGTNFIRVKNGDDGAMQIDVDDDTFSQAVLDITGGGQGGGTVKQVDGIPPDSVGNVQLGAIRSLNNYYYPDADGNVNVGLGVSSVNGVMPDEDGDVDLGTVVNTVNNLPPDADGNVNVGTVTSVNGHFPIGGAVDLGTLITGVDNVTSQDFGMLHLNAVRSVNGITTDSLHNYNVEVGTVKTVNEIEPDEDGNVQLDVVTSVNGIAPGADGNVVLNCVYNGDINNASSTQNVCSYLYTSQFYTGNVLGALDDLFLYTGAASYNDLDTYIGDLGYIKDADLSDYVTDDELTTTLRNYVTNTTLATTLQDYAKTEDLGDLAYMDTIEVDGHVSNTNGVVNFGLLTNKWLKSDANGHITTTDQTPVSIDPLQDGYLYAENGQLTYKDGEYVTLDTTQTITASKTFDTSQFFKNGSGFEMTGILGPNISLVGSAQTNPTISFAYGAGMSYIGRTSNGFEVQSDQILELQAQNTVNIRGPLGVCIYAGGPNQATLAYSPDTDEYDLAIATVGYLKNRYVDRTTDQTVDGIKTFMQDIWLKMDTQRDASTRDSADRALRFVSDTSTTFAFVKAHAYSGVTNELMLQVIKGSDSAWIRQQIGNPGTSTIHYKAVQHVIRATDTLTDGRVEIDPRSCRVSLFPNTNQTLGGYIDFHVAGNTANYTARIIDTTGEFQLGTTANKYLKLNATANYAQLTNAPTVARSDKTSRAIATCGWVNTNVETALNNLNLSQYVTQTNLTSTLANYVTTNTNQTITGTKTWHASNVANDTIIQAGSIYTYIYKIWNGGSTWGELKYGNAGIELAATGGLKLNAPTNGSTLANPPNDSAPDNCIATCGWVKTNGGVVKKVDDLSPDSNGNVDFGLAGDSIVMTDSNGHLTTGSGGVSANSKKVITGVSWNGTQLVITSENWKLENGVVTQITSNANQTISTVTYN